MSLNQTTPAWQLSDESYSGLWSAEDNQDFYHLHVEQGATVNVEVYIESGLVACLAIAGALSSLDTYLCGGPGSSLYDADEWNNLDLS